MRRPAPLHLVSSLLCAALMLPGCEKEAPEAAAGGAEEEESVESGDEILHFRLRPPEPGAVFQVRHDLKQVMTVTATDGEQKKTFGSEDEGFFHYAAEVVEADDDAATALDVAYTAGGAITRMGEEEAERPLPVVGEGYRISREADGLSVSSLQGPAALTEEERRVLEAHFPDLGRPDPLSAFLAETGDFTVGRDVKVPAESLRHLFQAGGDDSAQVRSAILTPIRGGQTSGGDPTGVFRLVAEVQYRINEPVPMATLVDFTGEVEALTENSELVRVDLEGSSQIAGATRVDGRTVALKGEGVIDLRQLRDWP